MSAWKVDVGSAVRREMRTLPQRCRHEVIGVLVSLEDGPSAFPDSELRGFRDYHRVRVCGSHRLIFHVSRSRRRVLVTRLEPRHRVYRGFER